ncbi:MAG: formyltransferase family protein, partial [Candidatus Promineifilaceae bacterium]
MRLLFFGMDGAFSYPPLAAVLAAIKVGLVDDLEVAAVVLPAAVVPNVKTDDSVFLLPPERPQSDLPLVQPYLAQNIIHLAWANGVPVVLVKDLGHPSVFPFLERFEADVGCAACFPSRVPSNILTLPKYGFLNIHPSLLPAYRGPSPLFWIFRNGDRENSGVTLHWMDERLDSGDILSQRPFVLPDGISGPEADRLCATVGGEMLLEALVQIETGEAPRRPQPSGGSYQSQPTAEAFIISRNWSARRAFNFMRGTAEWNHPYTLQTGSRMLTLTTAEAFDPMKTLPRSVVAEDGRYFVQF